MSFVERLRDYFSPKERVDTSPVVADEVKCTTCYMCACRCGIKVHLKDGAIRYIEGNRDHPINRGVICGKGAAGIMQQQSPAKLTKPLKRVGERGSGEFREIEWEEAISTAVEWLSAIRAADPKKLAFFTGRDQSQSLTGYWAAQFGTPNFAAHGGFCSVNMAAAGMYTLGSSFWEFGEPDWERTRFFMMFGVAEDHDSNPIKIALSGLRRRGAKFVSVNPVRTGYSAIADEWVGIRPGTDGLFVLALIHELLRADRIDVDYLGRYTNAAWLVIQAPGAADHGLFARNEAGEPLVLEPSGALASSAATGVQARLVGDAVLPDGRRAVPVFQLVAERCLDPQYAPEAVAAACGVPAATIRRLAAEIARVAFEEEIELPVAWTDWAGRRHETMRGRPVSLHAMRGISAHSNGFQTCRALHLLQILLGTIDAPGGWRYKSPHPKPCPPGPKPAGKPEQVVPGKPLPGIPLGYPMSPEDLIVDADGRPAADRQGVLLGGPDRRPRHDADGHPQCLEGRSLPDRHALHVHGQHGLELGDEQRRDDAHADRQGRRDRRIPHPADHLFRRLLLRDGRLRRPRPARHDLFRALGRHFAARPADRRAGRPRRRDPPADPDPRPRCPPVPGRLDRNGRPARAARLCDAAGRAALPRALSRLPRQPRAPAGGGAARRLARGGRRPGRARRAQPAPARGVHRQRLLLEAPPARGSALLQARQPGLSRHRGRDGDDRPGRPDRPAALCRAAAALPARRRGPRRGPAAARRTARGSLPISTRCRSGTCRSRRRGSTATPSRCTR